jgi:hypothetical protein
MGVDQPDPETCGDLTDQPPGFAAVVSADCGRVALATYSRMMIAAYLPFKRPE